MIENEIFDRDGDGELEEGEAIDEPLRHPEDEEEGEDEESGWQKDYLTCFEINK